MVTLFCVRRSHKKHVNTNKQGSTSSGGDKRIHLVHEDECESANSSSQLAAPEVGEALMVRRQLLRASKEKETTQRRSLFKTTYKCKGKVCKAVIDSGSTDNMVSNEMVDKLKLERIHHETPYKVS